MMTSSLIAAASDKKIQRVKALLKSGADVNAIDLYKSTTLMHASWYGYIKIVRVLLEANADVNIKDKDGITALMDASRQNRPKVLRTLLKAGADINIKDNNGKSALKYAIIERYTNIASIIYKYIILVVMLHKKFRRINKDIIREMSYYI
jgi:ankyrin repeat protein